MGRMGSSLPATSLTPAFPPPHFIARGLSSASGLPPPPASRGPASEVNRGRSLSRRALGAPAGRPQESTTLCPGLVLPARESHLEIPVAALQQAAPGCEVPIFGPLGRAWGKAVLEDERGSGFVRIDIFRCARQLDSLAASVQVVSLGERGAAGPVVEVRAADGACFAILAKRPGSTLAYEARAAGSGVNAVPLVVINGMPTSLTLTAVAGADGSPQASAARSRSPGGAEQLVLQMMKGADTAFLLACIVAIAVLF